MAVDREYRIKVITTADNSGADDATRSIEKTGEATKEAGKHSEQFNEKSKEMHRLVHLLDHAFPGLGLAIKAALHPDNLGLAGTLLIVHQLVETMREAQKELQERAKEMAESVVESQKVMAEALEQEAINVAKANQGIKQSYDDIAEAQKKTSEGVDKTIEKIHLQEEAISTLLKSQEQLLLASATSDEEKERIKQRFQFGQTATKEQASEAELQAREREYNEALKKRPGLQEESFKAQMIGSGEMGQQRRTQIAQLERDVATYEADLKSTMQELQIHGPGGKGGRFAGIDIVGNLNRDLEAKREQLTQLKKEEDAAKDNEQRALAREMENEKTITRGRADLPGQTAQLNLVIAQNVIQELRAVAAALNKQVAGTGGTMATAISGGNFFGMAEATMRLSLWPVRIAELAAAINRADKALMDAIDLVNNRSKNQRVP